MTATFLYFAYGSNLLRQRLLLRNPSAVLKCIAKLEGYELTISRPPTLNTELSGWRGGTASIEPRPGRVVWGVVWELDEKDRANLDRQEENYTAFSVTVKDTTDRDHVCITYQMDGGVRERTSPHYKDIILRGATQNGLPADYIRSLEQIEDNGFTGHLQLYEDALSLLSKG